MSQFESFPYRKRPRGSCSQERDFDSYKKLYCTNDKAEKCQVRYQSPPRDPFSRRSPERSYVNWDSMSYKNYTGQDNLPARRVPQRLSPIRTRSPVWGNSTRHSSYTEVRSYENLRDRDESPNLTGSGYHNSRIVENMLENNRRQINNHTYRDQSPCKRENDNKTRTDESSSRWHSSDRSYSPEKVESVKCQSVSPSTGRCSPKRNEYDDGSENVIDCATVITNKTSTSQNSISSLMCLEDEKEMNKEKKNTNQEKDFYTTRKEYLRIHENALDEFRQSDTNKMGLDSSEKEKQWSQAERKDRCSFLQSKGDEISSLNNESHNKSLHNENRVHNYCNALDKLTASIKQATVLPSAFKELNNDTIIPKNCESVPIEINKVTEVCEKTYSSKAHETRIYSTQEITNKSEQNHLLNNLKGCQRIAMNTEVELVNRPSQQQEMINETEQPSVSDSTPVEDGSQCNDAVENIEDEITEESRLIQLNPALREFDILDDLEESDREGAAQHSNSSEDESDVGEELPLEDVDAMLEESLPDKFKDARKNKEHTVKLKRKVVLEEIGYDHFDLLPEGWIQIMHSSGMPVYLHQKSRVCTMARPYYLGPGSSRNHKVPLSAIPCLQYRRALEVEKKNAEEKEKKKNEQNQSEIQLMTAKIETSEENEATQSLEALDLREYCKKVFNFKTITLIPFKSWADRRKYVRMTKDLKKRQRPSLPGGTKLLKFPIQNPDGSNCRSKGEWIINPNGKSYVCILHEYVQHALRKHPKYQFKELENPATPYSATVSIGDMQYSVGMGASKKQAKVEAAKAALEVLIPEMKDKIERDSQFGMRSGIVRRSQNNDISIFDQIRVEDPRVAEFCAKTTEPPPYAILLTCLSRNMGLGDIKVQYEMNSKKNKEDEFTMTVGSHTATVVCKNKRDGKQRAAQAILQALHPNITHWGSLLRMYGNRSIKNVKEKKQEEQEITGLQSKASLNQPNFAILDKLRTEMLKLKEKRDAIKAKGKFTPPENVILPSLSSTDLNKVNLS